MERKIVERRRKNRVHVCIVTIPFFGLVYYFQNHDHDHDHDCVGVALHTYYKRGEEEEEEEEEEEGEEGEKGEEEEGEEGGGKRGGERGESHQKHKATKSIKVFTARVQHKKRRRGERHETKHNLQHIDVHSDTCCD